MVVYYHEVVCHAENWFTIISDEFTTRAYITKNMTVSTFLLYFLNCQSATKLGLIVQHYKPEWPVQKLGLCVQSHGHSKGSKCE